MVKVHHRTTEEIALYCDRWREQGHETRQIRIESTKQRRRWVKGSEDDKVHAEEEHVVR